MARKPSFRSLRYALHKMFGFKTTRIEGLRVLCDASKINADVAKEIIRGSYELAERVLARAAIRPGDHVLEIGSGVGIVGLLCAHLVGKGSVTSYEANERLGAAIRENFALNGLEPRLRLRAITSRGGPVTFFRNQNVVSSSLLDRNMSADRVTVESDALDWAISDAKANVIVMDIEGAEIDLLGTAELTAIREIIVEVHPHIVGEGPTQAMLDALKERGFVQKQKQHKTIWLGRT
jgi:FkbM family methyltransferase